MKEPKTSCLEDGVLLGTFLETGQVFEERNTLINVPGVRVPLL